MNPNKSKKKKSANKNDAKYNFVQDESSTTSSNESANLNLVRSVGSSDSSEKHVTRVNDSSRKPHQQQRQNPPDDDNDHEQVEMSTKSTSANVRIKGKSSSVSSSSSSHTTPITALDPSSVSSSSHNLQPEHHQETPNQAFQDYSTFAWTIANNNRRKLRSSLIAKTSLDDNGGSNSSASPCNRLSLSTTSSSASPPYYYYANNDHPYYSLDSSHPKRSPGNQDLTFSTESSSLLLFASHNKKHHHYLQSQFLYAATILRPAEISSKKGHEGFMRLDDYSTMLMNKNNENNDNVITIASLDAAIQKRIRQQKFKQRIRRSAVLGAILGGLFALLLILVFPDFPDDFLELWDNLVDPSHHHRNYNNKNIEQTIAPQQQQQQPLFYPTDDNFYQQIQDEETEAASTIFDTQTSVLRANRQCLKEPCPSAATFPEIQQQQYTSMSLDGIHAYFDLFYPSRWFHQQQDHSIQATTKGPNSDSKRHHRPSRMSRRNLKFTQETESSSTSTLPSGSSSSFSSSSTSSSSTKTSNSNNNSPLLVIAGKMNVEGAPCNIAQYNLKTGEWSLDQRIQLSLYNSYSGGEVYSLLANYTTSPTNQSSKSSGSSTANTAQKKQVGSGELIVVGAFDTTYRNSQVTYCSVGKWNGNELSKVGEGLCNSALSKGMKITTASLAGPQDVYVAGSFQTQVWNGDRHEFVKIFNIAHFNAVEQVWLPLNVGQISCSWCTVTVLALAWDSKRRQLHVAGKFNSIDGRNVPAGLAIYDYDSGHLVAHPGGGLSMRNISQDGVGTALQLDEESGVLYVMGSFERLTQTYERCDGLAAYEIEANRWTCLADAAHTVYPTGGGNMLLTPFGLMVAGKTTPSTTWRNPDRPYTIALLKATLKTRASTSNTTSSNKSFGVNETKVSSTVPVEPEEAEQQYHDFNWSWLPGFKGHDEPLHALTNGFGVYEGSVFIAGDNLVGRWSYQEASKLAEDDESTIPPASTNKSKTLVPNHYLNIIYSNYTEDEEEEHVSVEFSFADETITNNNDNIYSDHDINNVTDGSINNYSDEAQYTSESPTDNYNNDEIVLQTEGQRKKHRRRRLISDTKNSNYVAASTTSQTPKMVPITEYLSTNNVRGAIMAISQMMPKGPDDEPTPPVPIPDNVNITIIVYCVSAGCIIGVIGAILCNRNISGALFLPFQGNQEKDFKGFSLDTLTYSAMENTSIMDAYRRAMETRYVHQPNLLTIIDPQEIFLQRIIGEGTFGRVWSAKWRTASVAVKEFVFAQAAVAGKSSQQQQIVDEIIGEAGMMAILRHPNVLQLFGCSLTAQAIWIVSELCSLGSLRQLLDDNDRVLPVGLRLSLALQVAEGMTYLHNQAPPIIHRDLKSHNIFVHETFTDASGEDASTSSSKRRRDGSEKMETHSTIVAKIGDWGSARATLSGSRTMTHGVGTACWLAPEVIKHARSSKFSDVYGYGIVLWELATREEVYQGLETTQIIAKVANENLRPPVPKDCPWKDIMVKCWAENPQDRLEFSEIDKQLNDLSKRLQESTSSSGLTNPGGGSASVS